MDDNESIRHYPLCFPIIWVMPASIKVISFISFSFHLMELLP